MGNYNIGIFLLQQLFFHYFSFIKINVQLFIHTIQNI